MVPSNSTFHNLIMLDFSDKNKLDSLELRTGKMTDMYNPNDITPMTFGQFDLIYPNAKIIKVLKTRLKNTLSITITNDLNGV